MWGTTVKGREVGKYLYDRPSAAGFSYFPPLFGHFSADCGSFSELFGRETEKKFLPKFKDGQQVLVEEIAEVMKEPFIFRFPQWPLDLFKELLVDRKLRWFPLKRQKSVLVWEETKGCPKGQVRIVYSGGKSNQNGMSASSALLLGEDRVVMS